MSLSVTHRDFYCNSPTVPFYEGWGLAQPPHGVKPMAAADLGQRGSWKTMTLNPLFSAVIAKSFIYKDTINKALIVCSGDCAGWEIHACIQTYFRLEDLFLALLQGGK